MSEDFQHLLANELANNLSGAIEGMTGEAPAITFKPDPIRPGMDWISWRQRFNASRGAAWLCAEANTWSSIGTRTLRAAGIEDSDAETARSTFAEILGQAFSMLARSFSGRSGREWTCIEGIETTDVPSLDRWTAIQLGFSDGQAGVVLVAFEDALLRALDATPASTAVATQLPEVREPAKELNPLAGKSKTLDLLLDVELPVSVSFGRAQLPLKDVIKLTTGSIVELNRTILEPVEVIVNNCVIARGEVVVVEGNFGVRIQQVISREERLRTLF